MILFFVQALQASFTGPLGLGGYPTGTATYQEPASSPLSVASAVITSPLTAGTVTVTVKKNGAAIGTAALSVGVPMAGLSISGGLREGDRLDVSVVTTGDLAPTTADLLVAVH